MLLVTDRLSLQSDWNVYSKLVTDEKQTFEDYFFVSSLQHIFSKFRYSEEATKFEKIFPTKTKWEISTDFCSLLRISEL